MFAPHYEAGVQSRLAPHLARIRALLSDDASTAHFDRVTGFNRTLDARHLAPQPKQIGQYGYDAPGANPKPGARIVDCGAFIGDSFDDFLNATQRDCRIYALEAFLPNLERMMAHVAREGLKDIVVPLHVAAARETGALVMSGDESIADSCARVGATGGSRGDVVLGETLDNLFLKHLPTPVDYAKIDIEGADLDALHGAEALLRTYRPVTAVAAYHRPDHIVEIAQFLHDTLAPCRLYAGHDPKWIFQIHYIAVPEERTAI
jgi:FkbM family methyltransferase